MRLTAPEETEACWVLMEEDSRWTQKQLEREGQRFSQQAEMYDRYVHG